MPRVAKPYRRPDRSGWWTKAGGKWTRLGDTRREAQAALHRLLAARDGAAPAAGKLTVAGLLDLWLDDARRRVKPRTWERYRDHATSLGARHERLLASQLRPLHITAWLDAHPVTPDEIRPCGYRGWNPNTRALAASVAKMAFRWAAREGWLDRNPLAEMRIPKGDPRSPAPPGAAEKLTQGIRSPQFAAIYRFLLETGVRPGEARTLESSGIDLEARLCVVHGKKGKRTVVLTESLCEALRPLLGKGPGPVFRNTRGEPWTEAALQDQFRRCRNRSGAGRIVPYSTRGIFATRAVEGGADSAVVAQCLGHKDASTVKMLISHYLRPDDATLRAAAEKARRSGNSGTGQEE